MSVSQGVLGGDRAGSACFRQQAPSESVFAKKEQEARGMGQRIFGFLLVPWCSGPEQQNLQSGLKVSAIFIFVIFFPSGMKLSTAAYLLPSTGSAGLTVGLGD